MTGRHLARRVQRRHATGRALCDMGTESGRLPAGTLPSASSGATPPGRFFCAAGSAAAAISRAEPASALVCATAVSTASMAVVTLAKFSLTLAMPSRSGSPLRSLACWPTLMGMSRCIGIRIQERNRWDGVRKRKARCMGRRAFGEDGCAGRDFPRRIDYRRAPAPIQGLCDTPEQERRKPDRHAAPSPRVLCLNARPNRKELHCAPCSAMPACPFPA